jgi:hypothetical protein
MEPEFETRAVTIASSDRFLPYNPSGLAPRNNTRKPLYQSSVKQLPDPKRRGALVLIDISAIVPAHLQTAMGYITRNIAFEGSSTKDNPQVRLERAKPFYSSYRFPRSTAVIRSPTVV